jgi:uncharacterized protein GlcG (DUF336 family)
MYERKELGTEECLKAVDAMIRTAQEDGGAPIAAAIVDSHGELICYARMDGYPIVGRHQACNEVANHMCIKKAYAAAMRGRNTREFSEEHQQEIEPRPSFAVDPFNTCNTYNTVMWTMLLAPPGGTSVVESGKEVVYGGIGVGGRAPGDPCLQDGDIERVGLKVIQDTLWPSP